MVLTYLLKKLSATKHLLYRLTPVSTLSSHGSWSALLQAVGHRVDCVDAGQQNLAPIKPELYRHSLRQPELESRERAGEWDTQFVCFFSKHSNNFSCTPISRSTYLRYVKCPVGICLRYFILFYLL